MEADAAPPQAPELLGTIVENAQPSVATQGSTEIGEQATK